MPNIPRVNRQLFADEYSFTDGDFPTSDNSSDMLTPYKEDDLLLMDEDSGLGMDDFQTEQPKTTGRRSLIFDCENTFVSRKRLAVDRDECEVTPIRKRQRHDDDSAYDQGFVEDVESPTNQSPMSSIISAVHRLTTESDVSDDASRVTCLPIIPGKNADLNCVSPDTVRDVLAGCYDNDVEKLTIIDCRYPYEYKEGHIKNAINLYTKDAIQQFLQDSLHSSTSRHVLIFHCEFSSKRGPKMYRFLRSEDRRLNEERYPSLHFPEVYLLDGGYKAFFESHQTLCYPQVYMPMLHNEHKDDLRHFRVKSKSWAAGDRPTCRSRGTGIRLSL